MSGYTPVFRSIFEGSLCGQWPYTAGWLIFLSLVDQHGNVDMTPEYISAITGMPIEDLKKCISRFTEPDIASRSSDEEGRRLTALDPSRAWGWHVVNHQKYREKARLMSKSAREVSTGENAERLSTAAHRRSPPPNAPQTHTQTHTKTKTQPKESAEALVLHASLPVETWNEWLIHRRENRFSMSPRALNKQLKLLARYDAEAQREMIENSIQAGWQGLFPGNKKQPKAAGSPYANAI